MGKEHSILNWNKLGKTISFLITFSLGSQKGPPHLDPEFPQIQNFPGPLSNNDPVSRLISMIFNFSISLPR